MRSVASTIDVDRPVEGVFRLWQRVEEFPVLTDGVTDVRRVGHGRTRWAAVIGRERREWEATVTETVPNRLVTWQSDGDPVHGGSVTFQPLDAGRTRIRVQVDWEPQGLFDKVGDQLGLVERQLERDLASLKEAAEAGGPSVSEPHGAVVDVTDGTDLDAAMHAATGSRSADDATASADGATGDSHGDGERRGRSADGPTEIPPRGWLDILKRTMKQLKSDNVPIVAAGVAFYLFLALAPALVAFISVYGLVVGNDEATREVESAVSGLPSDTADLITALVRDITAAGETGLGISLAISVAAALWSASKGMQALVTALNIAYDEDETRKFFRLRGLALVLTIGLVVVAAAGLTAMLAVATAAESLGRAGEIAVTIARWPVLALAVILVLAVLYRYAPDRDNARWRWTTPGAVVATVLWVLASIAFSFYVNTFGKFDESYGPLGTVVVLLLWLYLSAYIVMLGAELDSESERQTRRDSTEGRRQPLGRRDAYAADTVAS